MTRLTILWKYPVLATDKIQLVINKLCIRYTMDLLVADIYQHMSNLHVACVHKLVQNLFVAHIPIMSNSPAICWHYAEYFMHAKNFGPHLMYTNFYYRIIVCL